jgi:hypothetical protein
MLRLVLQESFAASLKGPQSLSDMFRPRWISSTPNLRRTSRCLVLRAQFYYSDIIKRGYSRNRPAATTESIPRSNMAGSSPKTDLKHSAFVFILRRTALAYLFSISLCLAWSGVNGWYLVLNGRGEEVDERSPLRIVWDSTRWPVDAARHLLRERE